MKEGDQKLS